MPPVRSVRVAQVAAETSSLITRHPAVYDLLCIVTRAGEYSTTTYQALARAGLAPREIDLLAQLAMQHWAGPAARCAGLHTALLRREMALEDLAAFADAGFTLDQVDGLQTLVHELRYQDLYPEPPARAWPGIRAR